MKLKVTKISVIKDGTRANLPYSEIVHDLEKFRSEMKEKYNAEKILFCMEEIEESISGETTIGKQIWSDLLDINVPGSVKINGIRYYTNEQALQAAKIFRRTCGSEWRLPTKEDFCHLSKSVDYKPDKLVENGFVKAGFYDGSSVSSAGSYGYYWSSTWYNNAYAYNMYFSSSGVYPQNDSYKYNGFAVRCVKDLK